MTKANQHVHLHHCSKTIVCKARCQELVECLWYTCNELDGAAKIKAATNAGQLHIHMDSKDTQTILLFNM